MTIHYEPHEMKLANEIATALNDQHSLTLHLQFVRLYKESFLRDKLEQALAKPKHKITSSRAAFYVFLVKHGEKRVESEETNDTPNIGICRMCGREYDNDHDGY